MAVPVSLLLALFAILLHQSQAFHNPIVPLGQDPSVKHFNNNYFLVQTISDAGVKVYKSPRLEDLGTGEVTTVWTATGPGTETCCEVWAPELVYWPDESTWYIYFAADDGDNANHRTYILKGEVGADPDGSYTFLGAMQFNSDHWCIDSTVIRIDNQSYFVWSGLENAGDNFQSLYIATMSGPTTITSDRHLISTPTYDWEGTINEGPAPMQMYGRSYLAFSAGSGDDYCLGLLTYNGGDPMAQSSWEKTDVAVFTKNPDAGVWATGHNSFVMSPDGVETWNVYHGDDAPNAGWGNRSVRTQQVNWRADGSPDLGVAVGFDADVAPPSGE